MTGRNCEAVAREQPHRKRDMDIASYLRINDQAGLGSHKCARSRSGKVVKHIAGLGVPTESQQSAVAIIILAQQGLFLPDWRCTMSRVHIIYLNRSCVQLYIHLRIPHQPICRKMGDRIVTTHAQRLVETLEQNALLARAVGFLVTTQRFSSVSHLSLPARPPRYILHVASKPILSQRTIAGTVGRRCRLERSASRALSVNNKM